MVALGGDEALLATLLTARNITDVSAKGSQLSSGMDCVTLAIVCILMHNEYGWPPMGLDERGRSHQWDVKDDRVSYAGDISLVKVGGRENASI